MHLRHVEQVRVREVPPELRGGRRLAQQVQLVEDGLLVLVHDLARVEAPRGGPVPMREIRDKAEQAHVATDDLADFRAHDLDHDLAAVGEPRGVHLGDRRRCQRLADELAEDLLDRAPQLAAHDRGGGVARERRHPVLEACELVGDVFGQQVAAGREDLTELDEDRAEVLQRAAQPHRAWRLRPADPVPGQEVEDEPDRTQQVRPQHDIVEAVPHQHHVDVGEPEDLAEPYHGHRMVITRSSRGGRTGRRPGCRSSRATRASRRSTSSRMASTAFEKRSTSSATGVAPAS